MSLEMIVHRGQELATWIPRLAEMRVRMFADFPYLYVGNDAYEAEYAEGFEKARGAMIVEARWEGRFAGIATGMPLREDAFILREAEGLFRLAGMDPAEFFYHSEFLVEPEFRGKGMGRALLSRAMLEGRALGFTRNCLMAVVRPDDHPLRPEGAADSTPFWERAGFRRIPGEADFDYPTRQVDGSVAMESNPMAFWTGAPLSAEAG